MLLKKNLSYEAKGYLYIIIYLAVNFMCYLFVIYFCSLINEINCNIFYLDKPATKVLSKLVAAAISFS